MVHPTWAFANLIDVAHVHPGDQKLIGKRDGDDEAHKDRLHKDQFSYPRALGEYQLQTDVNAPVREEPSVIVITVSVLFNQRLPCVLSILCHFKLRKQSS